jgi:mono/diheme cytochrome c family protein
LCLTNFELRLNINFKYTGFLFFILFSVPGMAQNAGNRIIPKSADTISNPFAGDPTKAAEGARVYKFVCWTCHGDRGNGKGPQAEELQNKPADFNEPLVVGRTDGALFWWISHGGTDMQAFENSLTKEERWAIVAYIRRLQKK